jgi:hypothetical protein
MAIPNSADPRSFGTDCFLPSGSIDNIIMKQNGIKDATEYRMFIEARGLELTQAMWANAQKKRMRPLACVGK